MTPPSLAALDRELVRRKGLYKFLELAWEHTNDPTPKFSPAWHLEALSGVLERLYRRELREHVIEQPPGTGKSILTGVFFPAWVWTFDPGHVFFYASYDSGLLHRDTRKLEALLRSPWYVERWGERLPPTIAVGDFSTLQGGGRFNTSFGGGGTGRHAHTQIIDDPIKAQDAVAVSGVALESSWLTISQTYASRALDASTFARLIVMQPLAEGDPADRAKAAGWTSTRLPMLAELDDPDPIDRRTVEGEPLDAKRFPPVEIERLKRNVSAAGPEAWETQYQLRRALQGGGIVKTDWIKLYRWTKADALKLRGTLIQSWDLSFKNAESSDFVAGQWWLAAFVDDVEHYFLLDAIHQRMSFVETVGEIRAKRKLWRCGRIVIEDKANGPACESVLSREMPGVIEMWTPKDSKIARFSATSPEWSEGRVHVCLEGEAYDRVLTSFPKFPRVRRDDEIDACSQALAYYRELGGYLGKLKKALGR